MSTQLREKRNSNTHLKHEADGTPYFEKTVHVKVFDPYLQVWVKNKSKTQVLKESLESHGLVKSCDGALIIKRTAFDEKTFKEKSALFLQKIEIKIPEEKQYKHVYLSNVGSGRRICLVNLDRSLGRYCGFTVHVELNEPEMVHALGEPEKISVLKARELIESKKVFGIFRERGNGLEQELNAL